MDAVVRSALDTWLGHHDRLAPGAIEGLYVVGSVALDDWRPASDIDIVAFTADPTDAEVVAQLEAAHDAYRTDGDLPTIDGLILAWADVTSPPLSAQRPWTLDGEFRFDGDCFEINPVVWYTLARYGIALRLPASGELAVHLDAADRRAWVRDNVDTYWRGVGEQIVEVLMSDPDRTEFSAEMQEWCALGIARMAHTHEIGDVRSKSAAGEWALDAMPRHADVLQLALDIRRGVGPESVARSDVSGAVALIVDVVSSTSGSSAG